MKTIEGKTLSIRNDKFKIGRILGQGRLLGCVTAFTLFLLGAFANVYEVKRESDGAQLALKQI